MWVVLLEAFGCAGVLSFIPQILAHVCFGLICKIYLSAGQNAGQKFNLATIIPRIVYSEKSKKTKKQFNLDYRQNLKDDQERYEAFKAAERERSRKNRANPKSAEKRAKQLEKQRERQRKYRERLAAEKQDKIQQRTTPKRTKAQQAKLATPKRTRAQQAKMADTRERNRVSALKMRQNYSSQKRSAVNMKRMQRYYAQKNKLNIEIEMSCNKMDLKV
ncbi:hypothetical protein ElyMa_001868700 [Elysia marginata]|uniref:Uncharacterized protein n=1 Tax=Elysia marginata TaxID=1093978 RepID=A0AAV4ENR7_9GAST|nr:hypothetical protein ElyMa_001868700 [Elysia marginata]